MASGEDPCPMHPKPTRLSSFRYCFFTAHHGRGAPDDAQWVENLSLDDEFAIFDLSDWHKLSDEKGHYYGLRRSDDGMILTLGTDGEQIAKFWNPLNNNPTHGFPLLPVAADGPANRKQTVVPRIALLKMESVGLLEPTQRKRIQKGKGKA